MHLRSLKPAFKFGKTAAVKPVTEEKKYPTSPPAPPPRPPSSRTSPVSCKLDLNNKGLLSFEAGENADILDPLLNRTLCHPMMTYQVCIASPNRNRHVLLDKTGRLITLATTPEGFIGITNSEQKPEWAAPSSKSSLFHRRKKTTPPNISMADQFISINGKKIALPDSSLNEYLTETTSDKSGRYRLHMKRLFRFNAAANCWETCGDQSQKKALLSRQGDGNVWTVTSDKTLSTVAPIPKGFGALSDEIASIGRATSQAQKSFLPEMKFDRKIEHFSVSRDGQAMVQLSNDDDKIQRIHWIENVQKPHEKFELTLPHGISCRKTALFDQTVFGIDANGKLRCAPFPSHENKTVRFDSAALNVRAKQITDNIAAKIGTGFKFEDVLNVSADGLCFVLKDKNDRRHYIAVNNDRTNPEVISAWNVTDSMILDHQQGLTPYQPDPKNIIDLDRMGKVTVYDNRPYFLNERTGQWENTTEERSDRMKMTRLRAGLDGHPWMIKDGTIKKLKVRESSNKVSHNNNIFILPQMKKSLSVDQAIPGMEADFHLKDFAAIDPENVITLDNFSELKFQLSDRVHQFTKQQIADQMGHSNLRLEGIGLNNDHDLFLLTANGQIFSQPETSWSQAHLSDLKLVSPPKSQTGLPIKFIDLHTLGPGIIGFEDTFHQLWTFEGGAWSVIHEHEPRRDLMTDQLHILEQHDTTHQLKGIGLNVKSRVFVGGMEKQNKIKTNMTDRIDAFVFRNSIEWPRPLKNAAYYLQHSMTGREGLSVIYHMQTDLAIHLRSLQEALPKKHSPPARVTLQRMSSQTQLPSEAALVQDLIALAKMLSASIDLQSKIIGHHYGLLDKNFRPLSRPRLRRRNSGMFNPTRSRTTNLTENLSNLISLYPIEVDNQAANLFSQMMEQKILMNQQKENVPIGMNRDVHDEIGLIKSRLIHDALITRHLHELIEEIQKGLSTEPDRQGFVNASIDKVAALRYNLWHNNPVKTITDQGFQNLSSLEANYDAIRQMVKAFSKDNHGMNVTSRTVLDASTQEELKKNLVDTLRSMQTGENIDFSRAYGMNASVSSYFTTGFFVAGNVSGRLDRTYHLQINRTDTGYTVRFGRSGTQTGNLNVGMVNNIFSEFDTMHPLFLDEAHHLNASKTLLLGGGFTLTGRNSNTNRLSLSLREEEIEPFIKQLISGDLNPLEMIKRGGNHHVETSSSQELMLTGSVMASIYLTLPFTSDNLEHENVMLRARASSSASISIASMRREQSSSISANGQSHSRSVRGFSTFDRTQIAAQIAFPTGPRVMNTKSKDNLTMYATPGIDFQLSMDNRISHKLRIDFDNANEITIREIDTITAQLEKQFTDNTTSQLFASLQRKGKDVANITPIEKLKILCTHFSQWFEPEDKDPSAIFYQLNNHGQKSVLLTLQSLLRQQTAFENKEQILSNAEYLTTYRNIWRIDHNSFCHYFSHLMGFSQTPTQADRINDMMKNDHHLASFIETLKINPQAVATLALEFNPSTRDYIERAWASKTLCEDDIAKLLQDRQNIRLKKVVFTQTVKKSDGFASPNFILGGSNSATVSMTEHLGSLHFFYMDNNDTTPATYRLKGRIAMRENEIGLAIERAADQGYILRSG